MSMGFQKTKSKVLISMIAIGFLGASCTPRDAKLTTESERECMVKPKACANKSPSTDPKSQNLEQKKSMIDDFSLAAQVPERLFEVISLIEGLEQEAFAKNMGYEKLQSLENASNLEESKDSKEIEKLRIGRQGSKVGLGPKALEKSASQDAGAGAEAWDLALKWGTPNAIEALEAIASQFRWTGSLKVPAAKDSKDKAKEESLRIDIWEQEKSINIYPGVSGVFELTMHVPLKMRLQQGANIEVVTWDILIEAELQRTQLEGKNIPGQWVARNFRAELVQDESQKMLKIEMKDEVKINVQDCLKMEALGDLTRLDQKGSSTYPMAFTDLNASVNQDAEKPKQGWGTSYESCEARPMMDYKRLVFLPR